jgi:hypothetical protein
MRENITRRRVIILSGGAFTIALAGCTGAEDDDEADPNEAEAEADEEEPEEEEPEEEEPEEEEEADVEYVDEADEQVVLSYGETAALSNGIEVTVHGVEIYDELSDEEPEERDQFALLHIEAENTSDEPRELPSRTHPDLYLLYGDQQVEPTFRAAAYRDEDYEQFEGDEVQGGVHREGHILFEVDEGYTQEDIDFLWQDEIFVTGDLDGDVDVRWTAGE